MTYCVFYGDALAMSSRDRHLDDRVRLERFSTEHEALNRARQLLEEDDSTAVAICDAAGNLLSGVRLQLKLGYYCD
jgi:pantothenate synthetase